MWQTSGAPHQLQPPARPQATPQGSGQGQARALGRRRPVAVSQASDTRQHNSPTEQSDPSAPWTGVGPVIQSPQQRQTPDTPPDPPDMPGINRAGLLNLRNKLRLNRPAVVSPPTNSYLDLSIQQSHGSGGLVQQEGLPQSYPSTAASSTAAAVATPGSRPSAVAAARLARRRSSAESQADPGADPSRAAAFKGASSPGGDSRVSSVRASPQRALLRKTSSGKTPPGTGQQQQKKGF